MPALDVLEGAARLLRADGSGFVQHTRACRADKTGCIAEDPDAARWDLGGALWRAWWDGEGRAHKEGRARLIGTVGTGWIWARWWLGRAGLRLIEEHPLCSSVLDPAHEQQPRVADALSATVGWPVVPLLLDMAIAAERANDLERV